MKAFVCALCVVGLHRRIGLFRRAQRENRGAGIKNNSNHSATEKTKSHAFTNTNIINRKCQRLLLGCTQQKRRICCVTLMWMCVCRPHISPFTVWSGHECQIVCFGKLQKTLDSVGGSRHCYAIWQALCSKHSVAFSSGAAVWVVGDVLHGPSTVSPLHPSLSSATPHPELFVSAHPAGSFCLF